MRRVGFLAVWLAACGGSQTVTLNAQNAEAQSGTAVLTPSGTSLEVHISIRPLPGGASTPQPAHVHRGSCGSNGAILETLRDVVSGSSTSQIDRSLSSLAGKAYVDVHEDAADVTQIVACGNVK